MSLIRRTLLALPLLLATSAALAAEPLTLRIADQKGNMRAQLEAADGLRDLPGYRIQWAEFPAAAPLAEALNAGAVDAKMALANGSVDTWATWEPYTAQAEQVDGARVLVNGRGLWAGNSFLAATDTALADPARRAALQDYLERLAAAQRWGYAHLDGYARTLAQIIGFPAAVARLRFERRQLHWEPIDQQVVADQQAAADFYHRSGLISQRLEARATFAEGFRVSRPDAPRQAARE